MIGKSGGKYFPILNHRYINLYVTFIKVPVFFFFFFFVFCFVFGSSDV